MTGAGVTAGALRYRAGQAVALFVLSALAVAACAFGPLYERAVEQAQLRLTLENTPVFSRGISATAASVGGDTTGFDKFLPSGDLERFYQPAVTSVQLGVQITADGKTVDSYLASRSGQCSHLHITAGRCPAEPGQVAVSSSAAKALHLSVGDRVPLGLFLPNDRGGRKAGMLTVAGLYRPFDADDDYYWFGHDYSSAAGLSVSLQTGNYLADTMFTSDGLVPWIATQLGQRYPKLALDDLGDITEVDRALRVDSVRLNDMSTIRSGVAALMAAGSRANAVSVQSTVIPVAPNVVSAIAAALDRVDRGRHDARQVIPAFAIELALLVLVVIGIVVVAAADQRRPELALARLRGRSAGRAARLLDQEFGVAVLSSIVPGFLLAWLGCRLASRLWLSDAARPELRWPVLAAAAAVVVAEVVIVAFVARRTARKPVSDMLRQVAQRSARLRFGVGEAALAAAAIAGIAVTLSGDRHNAVAVITPGFIAVLAGVVLSRVLAVGARAAGQRALWRGHISAGLAGLQIARRPTLRPVVIVLCVAVALIVSAADQWRVSERNRAVRAGAEVGASVVLTVHAGSAPILHRAVAAADPTGRYATPVIVQNPPNGPSVMAVDPASFGRIAAWGWSMDHPTSAQLSSLTPRRPPPVTLTGTVLRLRLSDLELSRQTGAAGIGTRGPVSLRLDLRGLDGKEADVRLGPLPEGRTPSAAFSAAVPCSGGCRLTRISLIRATSDGDEISLDAKIAALDAGRAGALHPVSLRRASEWADASSGSNRMAVEAVGRTLGLSVTDSSGNSAVQHLDVPLAVRALLTGPVPDNKDENGYLTENGLDGVATSFRPTGRLDVLPGAPGPTLLVDLDTAGLVATPELADSTAAVWLDNDDPARERALIATLGRHGVTVTDRDTTAAHRAALANSAPAWAMQLALVTALLAVLLAAIVMLISATAARRRWTYDVAALELAGVSRRRLRRAALLEQLVVAIVGVAVGTVMGLVGARLTLPSVPMFIDDVSTPAVLRPMAWASVGVAAVASLAVVAAVGVLVGLVLVRHSTPMRVQGGRG